MTAPKFQYKECLCCSFDAVCNCYDMKKYEYIKENIQKLLIDNKQYSFTGQAFEEILTAILAEVEKPYEDARIPE